MRILPKKPKKNKSKEAEKQEDCIKEKLAKASRLLEDMFIDFSIISIEEDDDGRAGQ